MSARPVGVCVSRVEGAHGHVDRGEETNFQCRFTSFSEQKIVFLIHFFNCKICRRQNSIFSLSQISVSRKSKVKLIFFNCEKYIVFFLSFTNFCQQKIQF